jgi:FKBP-type peptidyl-prolyl cis-trans isomerase FkpA
MIPSMRSAVLSSVRAAARGLAVVFTLATLGASCTSPTSPAYKSSFIITDLTVGTGTEAASGMTLLVNYTGWLYDETKADKKGSQFDASPAGQPFVFKLGVGQVIQGWDLGVVGEKIGGIRRLVVPADLAYGREGAGSSIPPNATLVFEIELINVVSG